MVLVALGYVLGAWLLQQQSELPSLYWLPVIAESYQDNDIKDNSRNCVIKVASRYGSMLLTGDIEKKLNSCYCKSKNTDWRVMY